MGTLKKVSSSDLVKDLRTRDSSIKRGKNEGGFKGIMKAMAKSKTRLSTYKQAKERGY
jgi:hypothetical protein